VLTKRNVRLLTTQSAETHPRVLSTNSCGLSSSGSVSWMADVEAARRDALDIGLLLAADDDVNDKDDERNHGERGRAEGRGNRAPTVLG
jgi:hypothetical protein